MTLWYTDSAKIYITSTIMLFHVILNVSFCGITKRQAQPPQNAPERNERIMTIQYKWEGGCEPGTHSVLQVLNHTTFTGLQRNTCGWCWDILISASPLIIIPKSRAPNNYRKGSTERSLLTAGFIWHWIGQYRQEYCTRQRHPVLSTQSDGRYRYHDF